MDTDTLAKADAALRAIKTHDLVFLHVEGPDEASHEGNLEERFRLLRR